MRTKNDRIGRIMAPAVLGIVTLFATVAMVKLISGMLRIGPHVGDIIAFDTANAVSEASHVRLLVARADRFACVIDLDTISHRGGSMVLEARLPGDTRSFILHWAGARTSPDAADCGSAANLLVDRRDIDILAFAAGGYGVGRKMPAAAFASGPF